MRARGGTFGEPMRLCRWRDHCGSAHHDQRVVQRDFASAILEFSHGLGRLQALRIGNWNPSGLHRALSIPFAFR